ncbi:hypothetical protein PV726_44670 [Streptomyces europaeiscabiei]|uniref:hypothetical protein n=1 Tax=Streptomyces europaeiscabiei TaxID=146819 RepID=UPI0029A53076|nr:hypothetical protein [Streptomyces europaeiscabiei]MDX3697190.1 hypothetical protein [Streptomyces europaeiscabiei]
MNLTFDASFVDPAVDDGERHTIVEMTAEDTCAHVLLPAADCDGTFARPTACDAGIVQEPTRQPYGVRDSPSAIPRAT